MTLTTLGVPGASTPTHRRPTQTPSGLGSSTGRLESGVFGSDPSPRTQRRGRPPLSPCVSGVPNWCPRIRSRNRLVSTRSPETRSRTQTLGFGRWSPDTVRSVPSSRRHRRDRPCRVGLGTVYETTSVSVSDYTH